MEKLLMCRICLVENCSLYVVVDKNLHELYEKLTNIAFETEDTRPIHVCSFCYAKLKQCWLLLRKCLEAENLFAQMMKEDYEQNPLRNRSQSELFNGFTKTPIASIMIKEELPADHERPSDIIEVKEEQQSDELEPDNLNNSYPDVLDIPPYHFETDSKVAVPVMEFKTEVEEEQENLNNICQVVLKMPKYHSETDPKDCVSVMDFKTEVEDEQEVSRNKQRATKTIRAPIAKEQELDIQTAELGKQKKDELTASTVIQIKQNSTSRPDRPSYVKRILKMSSEGGIRKRQDDGEGADFSDDGWMSRNEIDEMSKRKKVLNKIRAKRYRDKKKTDAVVSSQISEQRTITAEEEEKIKRRREYNKEKSKRCRDKKRATKLINLHTDQSSETVVRYVSKCQNYHNLQIAGPSTSNVP